MNCPWSWLRQNSIGFCEESLCAWIKQPANTWSNGAYLLVGLLIFHLAAKANRPHLKVLGAASLVTGIGSAFYHASGTYWGGVFDLGGMVLGTGVFTGLNMRRWRGWGYFATYATIVVVTGLLVAMIIIFPGEERLIYMLSGPCCIIEFLIFIKHRHEIHYMNYLWAWAVVGAGTFFWWLDISAWLCDPQNHFFNGHAAWHFLTALAYFFTYRFYAQFRIFEGKVSVVRQ